MMRWLYVNGADTRDEHVGLYFPMYCAAAEGHRDDLCKWLYEHGAAKDIKRRTTHDDKHVYHNGRCPLYAAFVLGSWRNVTRWLILNGALCKDGDSGKLDVETMKQDLGPIYNCVSIQESINNSIRVHTRKALLPIFTEPALWFSCFCRGYSPLLPSTHTASAETYPH